MTGSPLSNRLTLRSLAQLCAADTEGMRQAADSFLIAHHGSHALTAFDSLVLAVRCGDRAETERLLDEMTQVAAVAS